MTRTRFAPWLVFACIGTLVGCTSGDDSTGNTELNVLIPAGSSQSGPGAPSAFDIQQVEYTITCDDGVDFDPTTDPDIDSGPILDNDVSISGVLEVLDTAGPGVNTQDFGPDLDEVYVWQGFMDLPETAGCTVQLRARDGDGEVICSSTETFDINADQTTKVNVLMFCGISYQAPVGMLDLDGDFSFNVANYCPDLFVLNCLDSEPDLNPTFGVAVTGCQVRYRDADSQCGDSCDPQTCTTTPEGLTCTPGADPGVSTEISCTNSINPAGSFISCDGANPAASCSFSGDVLGDIGGPAPGPLQPGPGGFFVGCVFVDTDGDTIPDTAATPGATVTCTATTTDGDVDCDKTKTVEVTCPGLTSCQVFAGAGGSCDDGDQCTIDSCNDATCDGATAGACCDNIIDDGAACSVPGTGAPGTCDAAGVCQADGCTADIDCEDGNACTTSTCDVGTGTCSAQAPTNEGGSCDGGAGTCASGVCVDNCTGVDCSDGNVCTADVCDSLAGGTCSNPPTNEGGACDAGGGPGSGTCQSGVCAAPPVLDTGSGTTSWNAQPRVSQAGTCTYDSVNTICTGCQDQTPVLLQPGGGQCAQFGTQVFGGCEVPGGVLNAQLAIDATVSILVTSDGAGNVDTDVTIDASNPALSTAAGLVTVDAASIFTSATNANPATLQNDLNPAFAGQVLGAFTGGGNNLVLDSDGATGIGVELPVVTTAVTPISDPVDFDYDNFSLTLTIVASGTPLVVDDAGCDFNFPGTPVSIPQAP